MNKTKIIKKIVTLSGLSVLGAGLVVGASSCKTNDDSDFRDVGNDTGTN
jgi:hypothetical protein